MSDTVAELRQIEAQRLIKVSRACGRGADEIERLRSGLQHADATTESLMEQLDDACKERDEAVRLLREVSDTLRIENYFETADVIDAFLASQKDKP